MWLISSDDTDLILKLRVCYYSMSFFIRSNNPVSWLELFRWRVQGYLHITELTSFFPFFFFTPFRQVQVDTQTSHLADRTMDLCQVQIWPSTFTLRGYPEPHAGPRLGGKAAADLSFSFCLFTLKS